MLPARRGGSSREALQHDRVPRPHRAVRQELMAGERIVFVDDEEQIRKLLSTWLSRHGYEVTLANDGWEARKAIRAKMPDLVITDVNMPNMNGFELTSRPRGDHDLPRNAPGPEPRVRQRPDADEPRTRSDARRPCGGSAHRTRRRDLRALPHARPQRRQGTCRLRYARARGARDGARGAA